MGDGIKRMKAITGYSKNGLPYFRIGGGPRSLVIFGALSFKHQALSGLAVWGTSRRYRHFAKKFTTYYVGRKPGLPVVIQYKTCLKTTPPWLEMRSRRLST